MTITLLLLSIGLIGILVALVLPSELIRSIILIIFIALVGIQCVDMIIDYAIYLWNNQQTSSL